MAEQLFQQADAVIGKSRSASRLRRGRLLFERAVSAGSVDALTRLGSMLFYGEGGPKNTRRAYRLYRMAAAKGDGHAAHNIGQMYWWGDTVPQNRRRAILWFKKAAHVKHVRAQFRLGEAAVLGLGMRRDRPLGLRLLRDAARRGDPDAERVLQTLGVGPPRRARGH
jgi:uncharacterized protein